ncbi:Udp-n-acetylglucosamine--peptide n-acetylglucosaminyltransferase sec, partial [Globisporangium splendens]
MVQSHSTAEALNAADPSHATDTKRNESSLEVNGWRFYCCSEPAMSSDERRALANKLRLMPLVHLPEMVFAGNIMTLEHAHTGLVIQFRAEDALQMWADVHADQEYRLAPKASMDSGATQEYVRDLTKNPVAEVKTSETLPLDKLRQHVQILFYGKVILFEDTISGLHKNAHCNAAGVCPDALTPAFAADHYTHTQFNAHIRTMSAFRHPVLAVSHGPGPMWLLKSGDQNHTSEPARNVAGIWKKLYTKGTPKPKRILVISAHWESYRQGYEISRASAPDMIYDYGGFPDESYEFKYMAKGDTAFAEELYDLLSQHKIRSTLVERGYDHGVFVPMMLIRPQADIPIVTLSINNKLNTKAHWDLGKALAPLREQGTLIICSGQATHGRGGRTPYVVPYALTFQEWLDKVFAPESGLSYNQRYDELIKWENAPAARDAHPRTEHFIPFIVAAAAGMDDAAPAAQKLFGGWGWSHLSYASYAWGISGETNMSAAVTSLVDLAICSLSFDAFYERIYLVESETQGSSMVFRRGVALVCMAAVVALAGVSDVEAKAMTQENKHHSHHHHHQVKETTEETREYPNGSVRISTSNDDKKDADGKAKKVKSSKKNADDDDSSDDSSEEDKKEKKREHKKKRKSNKKKDKKDKKKEKKHEKKEDVVENVADNGEITRTYAHGSVRIFTKDNASAKTADKTKEAVATVDDKKDAHLHKKVTTTVKEIHVKKGGHGKHGKVVTGEVTKDLVLDEGENTIDIDGVNLKVTLKDNQVSVDVAGQHIEPGKDVTVKVPNKKSAPAETPKKAKVAVEEKVTKKQDTAAAPQQAAVDNSKKQEIDAKADRVTELATKLSSTHTSFFQSETAPIVFICGIIGALAAVIGIAGVVVNRARDGAAAEGDNNIQSVLDDSTDVDVEAGVAEDAPAEEADSFDDSESDNDNEEAGEFVNSHAEVAV